MRKILMRAPMSPFCNPDFMELSTHDLIGTNIGNLLFASSVCRTIMTENTQVDCIKANKTFSDEEIEQFNNDYDYFVIPLANAFRQSFRTQLNQLSDLIERLKIPCVVVGVGMQAYLTDASAGCYPFDKDVRRFVDCVLDKSAMLGLRGESTAQYLESLGYTPEKDFTIIGCPSMYLQGGKLPEFQKKKLSPDSSVVINSNPLSAPQLHSFMERNLHLMKNYYYVPQILNEMNAMYLGIPLSKKQYPNLPDDYPSTFANSIYTSGHGIGFLNINTWLEFLGQQDFSFGPRIHGNIAAIVSGIPCYVIAPDIRVEEIARYHYIPYTSYTELQEGTTIFDLYEEADYAPMFEHHMNNFHHYLDFLNANGVQHIYQESDDVKNCPFDERIKEINFKGPIQAFSAVPPEEQAERLKLYYEYSDGQKNNLRENIQRLKKKVKTQRGKIRDLEKINESQRKELDHKSTQMVIKLRKNVEKTGVSRKMKRDKLTKNEE